MLTRLHQLATHQQAVALFLPVAQSGRVDPPSLRTVIADDEPVVLSALTDLFEVEVGLDVVATATTGQELLEAVAMYRPVLVVTDVHMPGGGEPLFERLGLVSPKPVIIALSALVGPSLQRRLHRAGADRVLRKGLDDPVIAARELLHGRLMVHPGAPRSN